MDVNDDTDDLDVLDDTIFISRPISRHRMESFLVRVDEIGRDGEVLSTTRRFEGVDTAQDVARIIEDHKRLTVENADLKAEIERLKRWQITPEMQALIEDYNHALASDNILFSRRAQRDYECAIGVLAIQLMEGNTHE